MELKRTNNFFETAILLANDQIVDNMQLALFLELSNVLREKEIDILLIEMVAK